MPWALGFFLLTGRDLYTAASGMDVLKEVGTEAPRVSDVRDGVPEALVDVLHTGEWRSDELDFSAHLNMSLRRHQSVALSFARS